MKISIINKIVEYIYLYFEDEKKELYDYLYESLDEISKFVDLDFEVIEEELVDRESKYYKKLIFQINNHHKSGIKLLEIEPLYYLIATTNVNIKLKRAYFNKIEHILNNYKNNSKGFIYQDFVLLFLKESGINIIEQNRTSDGGLDIIGSKKANIMYNVYVTVNLYGQIKFYNNIVNLNEVKQLVKDKIYRVIFEKNSMTECQQALFISHKGFSNKAKEYAKCNNIILLDTYEIITSLISTGSDKMSLDLINESYDEMVTMIK